MPVHNLLLVRHSLPEIDPAIPASSWQLSAEGRRRCLGLADQIAPYLPARICSSQEPKALQTAALIAQHYNLPFETAAGLHEQLRERVPFSGRDLFTAQVAALFAHPSELVFGEETADQAFVRYSAVVDSCLQAAGDKNLVIVSHGTVMTLWAWRRLNIEPFSFWKSQTMPCILVADPHQAQWLHHIRYEEASDTFH